MALLLVRNLFLELLHSTTVALLLKLYSDRTVKGTENSLHKFFHFWHLNGKKLIKQSLKASSIHSYQAAAILDLRQGRAGIKNYQDGKWSQLNTYL